MLRTALLLAGLTLALSACYTPRYYPPHGPPAPAPDISQVTPPPPPIDAIRPKI